MKLFYRLNDDHSVCPIDALEWEEEFKLERRIVARTELPNCRISTVFLGFDHRFFGDGPPLLFETMIFGGPLDLSQWRYSSWDDAETGHAAAVRKARE